MEGGREEGEGERGQGGEGQEGREVGTVDLTLGTTSVVHNHCSH